MAWGDPVLADGGNFGRHTEGLQNGSVNGDLATMGNLWRLWAPTKSPTSHGVLLLHMFHV
jgi:hypothetical protein